MCDELTAYYEYRLWELNLIYLTVSGLALGLFVYSEISIYDKPLSRKLLEFVKEYGLSFLLACFLLLVLVLRAFL